MISNIQKPSQEARTLAGRVRIAMYNERPIPVTKRLSVLGGVLCSVMLRWLNDHSRYALFGFTSSKGIGCHTHGFLSHFNETFPMTFKEAPVESRGIWHLRRRPMQTF
jgi:hypothetical protein